MSYLLYSLLPLQFSLSVIIIFHSDFSSILMSYTIGPESFPCCSAAVFPLTLFSKTEWHQSQSFLGSLPEFLHFREYLDDLNR
ncbi:hypothetical protein F4824DRAFT_443427 [Ustulina deusta]|nr:hypothetical protein F4824DRAFT_443427 [Ustulina deusta]